MPAYQIEFNDLLQNAIKSYKLKNNITLTDKDTRDQIQTKLRQKLTTDYLSNLNFRPLNPHQTFQILKYCRNFIKATPLENPKIILNTIYQFHTSLRKVLPEKPEAIDKEIYEILPFELPIVKRSQTKAITNILHTIFNFDTLPETYFINR